MIKHLTSKGMTVDGVPIAIGIHVTFKINYRHMKLKYLLLAIFIGLLLNASAQKFITKAGVIEIYSQTPIYIFKGVNNQVGSILDAENGEIVSSALIRSFKFEQALVEDRFNKNYLDPVKFPKSTFQGKIMDYKKINFSENGRHDVTIEGKLTINGVTNYIKERGVLTVNNGNVTALAEFIVSLKAYKINVEKAYEQDNVLLKIHFNYQPYSI